MQCTQVYEQVETRAGFPEEAMAVYQRGLAALVGKNEAPRKDRGPSLLDPATARGVAQSNAQRVRFFTALGVDLLFAVKCLP